MINTLIKYNKRFTANYSHGNETADNIFELTDYASKLIICAPHATQSFCNKKEKCADLFTGALVQFLGEQNNVSTIIRTRFTPYKALISDFITENHLQNHYFLDIHGFNKDIDYDICLGIGSRKAENYPYLHEIQKIAQKYNLKTVVNHPEFTGMIGLTGRYQKTYDLPNVIQIELKQYLRNFNANSDIVRTITLPFFNDVIQLYK